MNVYAWHKRWRNREEGTGYAKNPVAKSLNQNRPKTIANKKKEEEKKRLKSMKDLYRLEYLT